MTLKRVAFSTRPIAIPATGALMGTPASISARLVPHTGPSSLEPLDSSISETTRMMYGNFILAARQ